MDTSVLGEVAAAAIDSILHDWPQGTNAHIEAAGIVVVVETDDGNLTTYTFVSPSSSLPHEHIGLFREAVLTAEDGYVETED